MMPSSAQLTQAVNELTGWRKLTPAKAERWVRRFVEVCEQSNVQFPPNRLAEAIKALEEHFHPNASTVRVPL